MSLYKSIKNALAGIPFLANLRIPLLAFGCQHGMSALQRSYKMTRIVHPETLALLQSGKPVIYAIYHGRMGGILSLPNRAKTTILISQSSDGEMVARAMTGQGFLVARGSPAKGAMFAAKTMLNQARKGNSVVMTVDGPRGPAFEVKVSVIRLAQVSQLPIVPVMCDSLFSKYLPSWDSFMYPHFFTTMLCLYDKPVRISKDADAESAARELEECMKGWRLQVDEWRDGPDKVALHKRLLGAGWTLHQSEKGRSVALLNEVNPTGSVPKQLQEYLVH